MTGIPRVATLVALVLGLTLWPVVALAHVTVTPDVFGPNQFGTFTFTVPNESDTEDTIGVDVRLPDGFVLEDAQQVPGWTTVIDKGATGVPTAVHWKGGSLAPGNFATFSLRLDIQLLHP